MFLLRVVIRKRHHLRLQFQFRCDQLCFLSNPIAGFSDHYYLWKESSDCLDFLDEDNHEGKIACMLDYLFWSVVASFVFHPIRLQDYVIINIYGKNQVILVFFFAWRQSSREGNSTSTFWLVATCCLSHPIKLKDSLMSNKTGENQLISLICYMEIIIKVAFKTTSIGCVWPDVPLGL